MQVEEVVEEQIIFRVSTGGSGGIGGGGNAGSPDLEIPGGSIATAGTVTLEVEEEVVVDGGSPN
jgi:hypothetical protein